MADWTRKPGILMPDGEQAVVFAGEHIGAEPVNWALDWTRFAHANYTREHSEAGLHVRGFQPVGAVRFLMPRWSGGDVFNGRIYADSVLFDRVQAHDPGTFEIEANAQGLFTFYMSPGLASTKYFVAVHGQATPFSGGVRRYQFLPATRTTTSFQLRAAGSPGPQAAAGYDRRPAVAVIYAERR